MISVSYLLRYNDSIIGDSRTARVLQHGRFFTFVTYVNTEVTFSKFKLMPLGRAFAKNRKYQVLIVWR